MLPKTISPNGELSKNILVQSKLTQDMLGPKKGNLTQEQIVPNEISPNVYCSKILLPNRN